MNPVQPLFREQHATVLRVNDFDKMLSWYQDVLGLKLIKQDDSIGFALFDLPGPSYLCLYRVEGVDNYTQEEHPKCLFNWRTDTIDETRQTLVARGVKCGEIMGGDGFRIFRFYDPEGTTFDCCCYDERYMPDKEYK